MGQYTYSNAAPTWSNSYLWPPLTKILQRVAPAPARVFELGCGNGATARHLASLGYDVTGVDPSQSGIALAQSSNTSARARFAVGSTTDDLQGLYGTFPVVVSLEVIEHCPSAREFMRAFTSLLAPDGVGIISTPYHAFLKNLAVILSGRFDHHFDPLWEGGHVKFFSVTKLQELFGEFGLDAAELHRIGRIPAVAKSVMAVVRRKRS